MFSVHQNQALLFKVFLFTMLTVIAWNQPLPKLNRERCSRDRSRIVHNILQEKFWPLYDSNKLPVPRSCPFHPERDTLFWPEKSDSYRRSSTFGSPNTAKTEPSTWSCPDCELEFHCSDSLLHHWDETHWHERSDTSDDSICLADYCDLFRCEYHQSKPTSGNLMNYYLPFSGTDCDPARFEKHYSQCREVMQQCTAELNLIDEALTTKLFNQLDNQICSYLTCQRYMLDLEDDSRRQPLLVFSFLAVFTLVGFVVCFLFLWSIVSKTLDDDESDTPTIVDNQQKLRLSFKENKPKNSNGSFFGNIFEFNRDSSTEPETGEFSRKQYPINSIIEEDEDIDSPTEIELSMKSFPIVSKRSTSHHHDRDFSPAQGLRRRKTGTSTPVDSVSASASDSSSIKREVCIEDLPMTTSARYVQPLKHSYSEQFGLQRLHHVFQHHSQQPLTSCSSDETYGPSGKRSFLPISRSFSHSQFRQMSSQPQPRMALSGRSMPSSASSHRMAPVRQYSLEEDRTWDQKSAHSHSSLSVRSTFSGPARGVSSNFANEAQSRYPARHVSNSALSYNSVPAQAVHTQVPSMPFQQLVHHTDIPPLAPHSDTHVSLQSQNEIPLQDYHQTYSVCRQDNLSQQIQDNNNQLDNDCRLEHQHRQLKQQLEHISHQNKAQTRASSSHLPSYPLPHSSHRQDVKRSSGSQSHCSKPRHTHHNYCG